MKHDLLFELGCEELPAKQVAILAQSLFDFVKTELGTLQFQQGEAEVYFTPRRLAFLIRDVSTESTPRQQKKTGPLVINAYGEDGKPLPAALGFAKGCGVSLDALAKEMTPKGEAFIFVSETPPLLLTDQFQDIITRAIAKLPLPKKMRWGTHSQGFLRPIKWIVALHGKNILPVRLFDLTAGNISLGHRLANPPEIKIDTASEYEAKLEKAFVMVNPTQRLARIQSQVTACAKTIKGHVVFDADLLQEVCNIVEWPNSLLATFQPAFLEVPSEVLITSMKTHQKCFAVHDEKQNLLPAFVVVSNQPSQDLKHIKAGNEKVMHARLKDAAFFYEKDKQITLQARIDLLKSITFQEKLGSLYEKSKRNVQLAQTLSTAFKLDSDHVAEAAWLLKADLTCDMVGEFPELQGIMGDYYARPAHDAAVAQAIREHYTPRFSGDHLPQSHLGLLLSLVDKIDTLYGFFMVGLQPKADKDPFALRRTALSIARILYEADLDFDLNHLFQLASAHFPTHDQKLLVDALITFTFERLKAYLLESGIGIHILNAASANTDNFYIVKKRIAALSLIVKDARIEDMVALNKRVKNILQNHLTHSFKIEPSLLQHAAEKALANEIQALQQTCQSHAQNKEYSAILNALLQLQKPIAAFFDAVMVMDENKAIRENRLGLLQAAQQLMIMAGDLAALS